MVLHGIKQDKKKKIERTIAWFSLCLCKALRYFLVCDLDTQMGWLVVRLIGSRFLAAMAHLSWLQKLWCFRVCCISLATVRLPPAWNCKYQSCTIFSDLSLCRLFTMYLRRSVWMSHGSLQSCRPGLRPLASEVSCWPRCAPGYSERKVKPMMQRASWRWIGIYLLLRWISDSKWIVLSRFGIVFCHLWKDTFCIWGFQISWEQSALTPPDGEQTPLPPTPFRKLAARA